MSNSNIIHAFQRKKTGAAGDAQVSHEELTAVFQQHHSRLVSYLAYRLGSRADAQDAAQVVFMRLWQRNEGLHRLNLQSMLFLVARNLATDLLRGKARHRNTFVDSDADRHSETVADAAPLAERIVGAKQELKMVRSALNDLPEKCRTAFVRYKFEEWSYADIAADMGVTESMVRKYVLRAMAYCAEKMAQLEGWE